MADEEGNRREIEKLRNWRHDEVIPALVSLRGRIQAVEVTLHEIEPRLERLARADEVAAAVRKTIWRAAAVVSGVIGVVAAILTAIAAYLH